MDVPTRWNSLHACIERFLLLKQCIFKSLIDLGVPCPLSGTEISALEEMTAALTPVKMSVEALCRRDANLLTADGILAFLYTSLSKLPGHLAVELHFKLRDRVMERRQPVLVSLLKYLSDPESLNEEEEHDTLLVTSKEDAQKAGLALLKSLTLHQESERKEVQDSLEEDEKEGEGDDGGNLSAQLERAIASSGQGKAVKKDTEFKTLSKEFALFEATGQLTPNLEMLKRALLTIKPTSVESERAFSCVGQFVSKGRASLGDDTINSLCVLKTFFRAEKKK